GYPAPPHGAGGDGRAGRAPARAAARRAGEPARGGAPPAHGARPRLRRAAGDVRCGRLRRDGPVLRGRRDDAHAIVGPVMTGVAVPFRDTFWNVPAWAQLFLYVGGVVAIAIFVYGLWQRVRLWRAGGPESRLDRIPDR